MKFISRSIIYREWRGDGMKIPYEFNTILRYFRKIFKKIKLFCDF